MSNPIQWCNETLNVVIGCSPVSAGCSNCYASRMASRFCKKGKPFYGVAEKGYYKENGDYVESGFTGNVEFRADRLYKPFSWKKPRRIFVTSMGDLWHPSVTDEQIAEVFGVIAATPRHIYMDLTKRPERRMKWLSNSENMNKALDWVGEHPRECGVYLNRYEWKIPFENYWSGVSIEDQDTSNDRVSLLVKTNAVNRFVSYEPAIDFAAFDCYMTKLSLVIIGAETGPGKRKMDINWARSMRDRCAGMRVPFWFKKDSDKKETLDGVIHHPEFWK